jgi:hypothetical protein
MRTAEAHKWTQATLDRAFDDVRRRALPRREEADQFLREEEQEQRSRWMSDCQKMAQRLQTTGQNRGNQGTWNLTRRPASKSASVVGPGKRVTPLQLGPARNGPGQHEASGKEDTPPAHPQGQTGSKG